MSVQIPDFEIIEAQNRIPSLPNFELLSIEKNAGIDEEGYELSNVQIVIKDDASHDNYYELILNSYFNEADTTSLEYYENRPAFAFKNDLVLENEGILELWDFVNPVFSDELFNGKEYLMNVKYYPGNIVFFDNYETVYRSENHDLIVILRNVSKDYYTYKKRLLQHLNNQYSDIWDGVGEPAPMFTNIKNGYGIFAGYSEVTDTIFKK